MDNAEKLAIYGTQDEERKNNTIRVGHHHTQTNTNNVNNTWALLQTTGGKVVIFCGMIKLVCIPYHLMITEI